MKNAQEAKVASYPQIKKYYIGSGQTGAFFTLRVVYIDFNTRGYLDTFHHHVKTLNTDFQKSLEIARAYVGEKNAHLLDEKQNVELRKITREKIDHTILRFGKHEGATIQELIEQGQQKYLVWCAKKITAKKHAKTIELIKEALSAEIKAEEKKDEERRAKWEEVKQSRRESIHVGTPGKRYEMKVTFTGNTAFETMYGTMRVYFMYDEDNNALVWKTSKYINFDRNTVFTIKATIKEHSSYKGQLQTIITRVKITGEKDNE